VGRKVSASTLNASTLARPVFIVDSHVLRILQRLRFTAGDGRAASEQVTGAVPGWSADDLLFFHDDMKRLGQTHCHVTAPDCASCALAPHCPSAGRIAAPLALDLRSG